MRQPLFIRFLRRKTLMHLHIFVIIHTFFILELHMPLLAMKIHTEKKEFSITGIFFAGGLLLIVCTLFDWLIIARKIYPGHTDRYFP
ncbi:MAG TPA: hypothetical protein VK369_01360 [Segetibacter sp.]|nr:hypothetical protein [Segetibacter sp.]